MIKRFLANKKPGFYISIVGLICGLVALICYTLRGGNYLAPVSTTAVLCLVFGIISNLLVLVFDFQFLAIIPTILYSAAGAVMMNTEMLFITNVLFGVDGNYFDGAFYTFLIMTVLAILANAVAFSIGLSKSNKLLAEAK